MSIFIVTADKHLLLLKVLNIINNKEIPSNPNVKFIPILKILLFLNITNKICIAGCNSTIKLNYKKILIRKS